MEGSCRPGSVLEQGRHVPRAPGHRPRASGPMESLRGSDKARTSACRPVFSAQSPARPVGQAGESLEAGSPLTFSAWVNMILLHTRGTVVTITMARSRGSGMNSLV